MGQSLSFSWGKNSVASPVLGSQRLLQLSTCQQVAAFWGAWRKEEGKLDEMALPCPACPLKDLIYFPQTFFDKVGRHSHGFLNTGVLGGLWTITSLSSREGDGLKSIHEPSWGTYEESPIGSVLAKFMSTYTRAVWRGQI